MSIKCYSLSEADRKWYVKCTFETARYPWPLARQGTELKRVRQRLQIEDRVDSLHIARQIVDRIRTRRGVPIRRFGATGGGAIAVVMSARCGSKIWPGVSRASRLPDDLAGSS